MTLNDWFPQNLLALRQELLRAEVGHPIIIRCLAYVIDYVGLGVVIGGGAITLVALEKLDDYWIILDSAGVLLTLAYFTIGASRYGGGMTLGKRFFKIKVVHEIGSAIGVGRALLRSVPLAILTNGFNIVRMTEAVYGNPALTKLSTALILLLLAGVLYFGLLKLNRQGLHDLLASTQVVTTGPVVETKKHLTGRLVAGYFVVSAALVMLVLSGD